jgi:hypothetical protein
MIVDKSFDDELLKYKLALFTVVRNSQVIPMALTLNKTVHEVNEMSVKSVNEIFKQIDWEKVADWYRDGGGVL